MEKKPGFWDINWRGLLAVKKKPGFWDINLTNTRGKKETGFLAYHLTNSRGKETRFNKKL
jgi:hypothetical protein